MKWFGHSNKTSAFYDHKLTLQVIGWSLAYFILVWFVITSRRRRLHTLTYGTFSLFAGALLSLGICDSNWMTGCGELKSSYSRWTKMKHGHSEMLISADLTVHIGLTSINVTFASHESESMNFFYNEELELERRLRFDNTQIHNALEKGLPNPILSVLEFILQNSCTCNFEKAGYLTQVFLIAALIIWFMNQVIYINVPRLAVTVSMLNGCWILIAVNTYVMMIQKFSFVIYVEGSKVNVSLGRSVALVTVSAVLQLMPRFLVLIRLVPKSSFEVDFGTPWDKQYVIDHQHERQQSKITGSDDRLKDKISTDDLNDDLKKGQDLTSDILNDLKKKEVITSDINIGKASTSDLQNDLKQSQVFKSDLQSNLKPSQVFKDDLQSDLKPSQVFKDDLHSDLKPSQFLKGDLQNDIKPSQVFKGDLQNNLKPSEVFQGDLQNELKPSQVSKRDPQITVLTPDIINANLMETIMRDSQNSNKENDIFDTDCKVNSGLKKYDECLESNINKARTMNFKDSLDNTENGNSEKSYFDVAQCTYKHKHYHKPHTDTNCKRQKHHKSNHNDELISVPCGIDNPAFDPIGADSTLQYETKIESTDSSSTISSISSRVESSSIGSTVSNLLSRVQLSALITQNNPGSKSEIPDQAILNLQKLNVGCELNKIEEQLLSPGKLDKMSNPSFDPRHRTSTPDINGDIFSSGNKVTDDQSHDETIKKVAPNNDAKRPRLPSVVNDNELHDRKRFWRSRVYSITAANELSRRANRANVAVTGFSDPFLIPDAPAREKQRAKSFNDTYLNYGNPD